jgi:hypothetical protein
MLWNFSRSAEKNERDTLENSEAFLIILFKILCKKKTQEKIFRLFCYVDSMLAQC